LTSRGKLPERFLTIEFLRRIHIILLRVVNKYLQPRCGISANETYFTNYMISTANRSFFQSSVTTDLVHFGFELF